MSQPPAPRPSPPPGPRRPEPPPIKVELPPEVMRTVRRLDSALFLFHLAAGAAVLAAAAAGLAELARLWAATAR